MIDDGDPVIFNTQIEDQSPNISYDDTTGEFTINQAGIYYVSWWVDTESAEASLEVSFGVSLNGGTPVLGTSPIVSGQLNGTALVVVGATPATLELVNATGVSVTIPATAAQANIVILEVSV